MLNPSSLDVLADAFIAGDASAEQVFDRASRVLGRPWPWLRPLANRYARAFAGRTRPRRREVLNFLFRDRGFALARANYLDRLSVENWLAAPPAMAAIGVASSWNIKTLSAAAELANWLGITPSELDWFADLKDLAGYRGVSVLSHYHYRVAEKRSGELRLIEAPKPRLRAMQRSVLAEILEKVPAHPAPHGFVRARSIRTFVEAHLARRVVLRMDLQNFFPSISGARVQAVFRTFGYPERVADTLGGVCTNATRPSVWKSCAGDYAMHRIREARQLYARPHLPQGSPVSPALANICFYRADCRLAALARATGATYTRYADDLAFSGDPDFERRIDRFSTQVAAIVLEEGFCVRHRKTRVMRQGVRQHLAGLVVNRHANVPRPDFDLLKATLTNCLRHGPHAQNRDNRDGFREHLLGRISFVAMVNPARGQRLRAIYDKITWGRT